jgi:acetyl-CoA carboxylase carboxyl transferase subunit beta
VIVHGDTDHAEEQARRMRIRAVDLLAHGTVHHVVPEPDGDTGEKLAEAVAAEIAAAIRDLRG